MTGVVEKIAYERDSCTSLAIVSFEHDSLKDHLKALVQDN
jgi:hypothetical protein